MTGAGAGALCVDVAGGLIELPVLDAPEPCPPAPEVVEFPVVDAA
jgi:hypothetical protein